MLTENRNTQAEDQIRANVETGRQALLKRDLETIMSFYAPEVVAYDAIFALQFKGIEAYRKHWEASLSMCPNGMAFDIGDVTVIADENVAFAHYLVHCGGTDEKGETNGGWMRATQCLRRIDDQWKIVHEHYSSPFDPASGKTLFDVTP